VSAGRALRALQSRDFRLFWLGAIGSSIGNNMQIAALAWVVAVATRSPIKVTLIAFVTIFPLLVLGPLGGALADRFARRRLLVVTQAALMLQSLVLFVAWETDHAGYGTLFVISLLGGVLIALNTPAWQSIVPLLVPRPHLQNAIMLNSTQFNVARAAGPMIAGLLIAHVGAGICFLVNALSFVLVLGALFLMSGAGDGLSGAVDASDAASASPASLGVFAGFVESLRYLRGQPGLRVAIGSHAVFALLAAPIVQLIPVMAVEVLDVGPEAYGLLLGSFGVGAVAVAVALGVLDEHLVPSRLLAGGLALAAFAVCGLGLAPVLAVGIVFMALFGAAYVTVVAIDHSAIQSLSDDRIRGRVTGLWLMTFGTAYSLGTITQGAVAEVVGVRAVLVGSAVLVAMLLGVFMARGLLSAIDPVDVTAGEPVGGPVPAV